MKDYSKVDDWLETWGQEMRGGLRVQSEESILGQLMRVHGHSEPSEIAMVVDGLIAALRPVNEEVFKSLRLEYLSSLPCQQDKAKKMGIGLTKYKKNLDIGRNCIAYRLNVAA